MLLALQGGAGGNTREAITLISSCAHAVAVLRLRVLSGARGAVALTVEAKPIFTRTIRGGSTAWRRCSVWVWAARAIFCTNGRLKRASLALCARHRAGSAVSGITATLGPRRSVVIDTRRMLLALQAGTSSIAREAITSISSVAHAVAVLRLRVLSGARGALALTV